jgi:hypothetical protein
VGEWLPTFPNGFFILGIEVLHIPNFLKQKCNNKFGPNWALNIPLKKVLKHIYQMKFLFLHLEFWTKVVAKKKGGESYWLLDSQPLKLKKQGPLTFEVNLCYVIGKVFSRTISKLFHSKFFNWNLYVVVMNPQSCKTHNLSKLIFFGKPINFCHLDAQPSLLFT